MPLLFALLVNFFFLREPRAEVYGIPAPFAVQVVGEGEESLDGSGARYTFSQGSLSQWLLSHGMDGALNREGVSGQQLQFQNGESPQWGSALEWYKDWLGIYKQRFLLTTWEHQDTGRELRGELSRVYPYRLEQFERPQVFRERVVISPGYFSRGHQWLTIRPHAQGEDKLWLFSPILDRARRMDGINREDRLFESVFSLGDLGLFGRSPYELRVVQKSSGKHHVPFITERLFVGDRDEDSSCVQIVQTFLRNTERDAHEKSGLLNEHRMKHWLAGTEFFKRETIALDLKVVHPYANIAREELIIDVELTLPVYRTSYDIYGKRRFSSVLVFGFSKVGPFGEGDSGSVLPVEVATLIFDHKTKRLTAVQGVEHTWCPLSPETLNDYEPQRFAIRERTVPSAVAVERENEELEAGDDTAIGVSLSELPDTLPHMDPSLRGSIR
jgi:hypothetical protein